MKRLKVRQEEGWEEGREEGFREGCLKGREEGRQEIIANMKAYGFTDEQIKLVFKGIYK